MSDNQIDRNIRLTIGIPTFNGGQTLKTTLESIGRQLEGEVELLISDNASTDATPAIIREFQSRYPVSYFRNDHNVGFDRNLDLVVRRSRGRFVWIFADDNYMVENAIRTVLEIIDKAPEVAAIYVHSMRPYMQLEEDKITYSGDEFFKITNFGSGGITSNVVNKAVWEKTDLREYIDLVWEKTDLSDYRGSEWVHLGFLFKALCRYPAYIYRDDLYLELDAPKKSSLTYFATFLKLAKIAKTLPLYGYSKETQRRCCLRIKGGYWHYIPSAKAKGLKIGIKQLKECIRLYREFPSFWLIDLPIMLIPNFIYRVLWKIYCDFFKDNKLKPGIRKID